MRHRVAHRKLGPRHGASHLDAPEPGDGPAPLRASDNDRAESERATAVRGAPHHDRQARHRWGRRQRPHAERASAGHAGSARPRGRHQAVRHPRAAVRRARRRLHAAPPDRVPQGDSAEIAQVELVGSEFNPSAKADAEAAAGAKPKAKGVGGRLRAAAERLRGKKKDDDTQVAPKPSRGVSRKSTTPRKAGGS